MRAAYDVEMTDLYPTIPRDYFGDRIRIGDRVSLMATGYGVTTNMTGVELWEVVSLGPKRALLRPVSHWWPSRPRVRFDQLRLRM